MPTSANTAKPYLFETTEARSFSHPILAGVTKHIFLIQAKKLPPKLPTGANARDPVGMSRRVYRDVTESLKAKEAWPGSFDLMNLGITILADRVEMPEKGKFIAHIRDDDGVVNGAHTCRIIEQCQSENSVPDEQYVEVRIITGIRSAAQGYDLKADIAKGQNTGIAVKDQSIYEIQGVFDGIKAQIAGQTWVSDVAWKESDKGSFDVRDLIAALEAINVIDFPNDGGVHPIHAYEKSSKALEKYADDFKDHPNRSDERVFAALEPLLLDALDLFDRIRHDFRELFNEHASPAAGRMRIVEEGKFEFPFSKSPPSEYRLTKGAAFPIFAAFRNCVEYDRKTNKAAWVGGYTAVKKLWKEAGPELVKETYNATRDVGHLPDQLGKSRGHWAGLHRAVENRMLRRLLDEGRKQTKRAS
jgi:hypothetical protein